MVQGYFDNVEVLNTEEGWKAFLLCVKAGCCISGKVVRYLIEERYDKVADSGYVDFEDAARWTISHWFIFDFGGEYYRVWMESGLTDYQENEYYDQTPERVILREVRVDEWMTEEEANY